MTDAVNIKIDGQEFTDFTRASISKSIETLAGVFSFDCTSTPNIDFPIKVNSKCEIIVKGETVINGYIEKLNIDYDDNSHTIIVGGRDRTADIMDSTVGGSESSEFQSKGSGITLKQITEKVLQQFNLSDIKVIDNENLKPFKQSAISSEYGSTVFEFLEKYAKKRQVLLTTNGDGDIVFTRTPTQIFKTSLILSKNAPSTIKSASIRYNNSRRFNQYIGSAQNNPSGLQNYTLKALKIASTEQGKPVFDNKMPRKSRIYHFEPDFSAEQESLLDRVKWEANFRRSQSEKLIYTLEGFIAKDDNEIWKPARLVRVTDKFADILNGLLLISEVTYKFSLDGSKTILHLLPEDAFSLIVNKPESSEEAAKGDTSQYVSTTLSQARKDIAAALKGENR